ncbi:bacteriocin immunity protein [Vagococcus sp. PNs007]|uniref:Bacteriocin immunity protein n=1 Tax=Vagococcus proximus TaxID=2991417 RepID=A0ABT5WZV6_9ENTE|nr:bacteriocin immunity protein [Vagococcus proximus]MDF0479164.1 bacteriocin immunity protein [Vagococcus proximus]
MDKEIKNNAQRYIGELIKLLESRTEQPSKLLDITDVLSQVSLKLDSESHPEVLVNKLVNYIRSAAIAGRINFSKEEESLIIKLGIIGQKAGINGQYMADFSDKSQFYSIFDTNKMPRR